MAHPKSTKLPFEGHSTVPKIKGTIPNFLFLCTPGFYQPPPIKRNALKTNDIPATPQLAALTWSLRPCICHRPAVWQWWRPWVVWPRRTAGWPACRTAGTLWSRPSPSDSRYRTYSWTWRDKTRHGSLGLRRRIEAGWGHETYSMGFPLISAMMALSPPRYS